MEHDQMDDDGGPARRTEPEARPAPTAAPTGDDDERAQDAQDRMLETGEENAV